MTRPDAVVYFDGNCPICRREIGFYRRQTGGDRIAWVDVGNASGSSMPGDLCREAALRRFHLRKADGELVSGALAFAELWALLPRFAVIGRIARLPGIWHVLEAGYRVFLVVRRNSWRPTRGENA